MIAYIEEFLDIAEGSLTTEFGALLGGCFLFACAFMVFKTFIVWIETIFGRR